MAKKNDALVGQLLKKVEEKKAQIKKIKNPSFKTNLSLPVDGTSTRINLNVASPELLFRILVDLETRIEKSSAVAGKYDLVFDNAWHGFTLEDWRTDVVLKIKQSQAQRQVTELRTIEKKLEGLMSEDKRTNIELEKLSELLGD
jgi:hypothetical protein